MSGSHGCATEVLNYILDDLALYPLDAMQINSSRPSRHGASVEVVLAHAHRLAQCRSWSVAAGTWARKGAPPRLEFVRLGGGGFGSSCRRDLPTCRRLLVMLMASLTLFVLERNWSSTRSGTSSNGTQRR